MALELGSLQPRQPQQQPSATGGCGSSGEAVPAASAEINVQQHSDQGTLSLLHSQREGGILRSQLEPTLVNNKGCNTVVTFLPTSLPGCNSAVAAAAAASAAAAAAAKSQLLFEGKQRTKAFQEEREKSLLLFFLR